MAETRTSWTPGVSGNPKGRPPAMRTALRKAMNRSEPPPPGSTMLDLWAWRLVTTPVSWDRQLELMRFIEGESGNLPGSDPAA